MFTERSVIKLGMQTFIVTFSYSLSTIKKKLFIVHQLLASWIIKSVRSQTFHTIPSSGSRRSDTVKCYAGARRRRTSFNFVK